MILDRVGLCRKCEHAKIVESSKETSFYYCLRSKENPEFPKYPRLPVLTCPGFERKSADH